MNKNIFLILITLWITTCVSQPLTGTYTIGTGGSYSTLPDGISALTTNGISGPVIFNILPGSYNSMYSIPAITGSSPINTITIQSQTLNPNDVTIYRFNIGASYINIKYFKFDVSPSIIKTAISLSNANHVNITNCSFQGGNNIQTSFYNENVSNKANNSYVVLFGGSNHTIANNTFGTGGTAIYKADSPFTDNVNITGNTFNGISVSTINLIKIRNLTFSSNLYNGIVQYRCFDGNSVSGTNIIAQNTIISDTADNNGSCIRVIGHEPETATILFKNNVVSGKGGIWAAYFDNVSINNNSIRSQTSACITINSIGLPAIYNIYNNVYFSPINVPNLYLEPQALPVLNTGNNAFSKNIKAIHYGTDNSFTLYSLENWKNEFSKEQNSIVAGNPYVSVTDLHTPNNQDLDGHAISLPEVTNDINGNIRNAATPDIGAYEYTVDPQAVVDLEIVSIVSPSNAPCEDTGVILSIKNNSAVTISNFKVESLINDFPGNVSTFTNLINPGQTIQVTVANCPIMKNTVYDKLEFIVQNPNNGMDMNYGNSSKIIYNVLQLGSFEIKSDNQGCDSHTLYAPVIGGTSILWSTGETSARISVSGPGTYSATITDDQGCTITDSIILN